MGKASRGKWERRLARAVSEAETRKEETDDDSVSGRFFRFAEHSMSIAAIGIIGGLGSAFLYGPILTLCVLMFALALHRSKAVSGLSVWSQVIAYAFVISISGSILFELGRAIESHKSHPLTAEEIWKGHTVSTSSPVTNIYQTTVAPSPKGPLVDLGEPYPSQMEGKLYFTVEKTNIGDQIALNSVNTPDVYVRPLSVQSEESIFRELYQKDAVVTSSDAVSNQGIGIEHRSHVNFPAHFTPDDLIRLQDKKNGAYIAMLVTYSDSRGIRHSSEVCWIYSPLYPTLGTCNRHNVTK